VPRASRAIIESVRSQTLESQKLRTGDRAQAAAGTRPRQLDLELRDRGCTVFVSRAFDIARSPPPPAPTAAGGADRAGGLPKNPVRSEGRRARIRIRPGTEAMDAGLLFVLPTSNIQHDGGSRSYRPAPDAWVRFLSVSMLGSASGK
jgi:hypothetical protein